MNKILKERSSNTTSYKADSGEPDTGWTPGGVTRVLGLDSGKPEPWYDQLEFEQVDFPIADHIYGSRKQDIKHNIYVQKKVPVGSMKATLKDLEVEVDSLIKTTKDLYTSTMK
tara:strand:- start:240 stop:578 length:339 start_codon:yes stop_codon:yes gene_type:complete